MLLDSKFRFPVPVVKNSKTNEKSPVISLTFDSFILYFSTMRMSARNFNATDK